MIEITGLDGRVAARPRRCAAPLPSTRPSFFTFTRSRASQYEVYIFVSDGAGGRGGSKQFFLTESDSSGVPTTRPRSVCLFSCDCVCGGSDYGRSGGGRRSGGRS